MRKHYMLDCYGANQNQLDDAKQINTLLNHLVYTLKLSPVCPPQLIPYYYGKVKEDLGISAFVILEGGHITIHTFPIRQCYFVDIYSEEDFDEKLAYDTFMKELPFKDILSFSHLQNRNERAFIETPYEPSCDFGPHIMSEIVANEQPTMEKFFDFLEDIVNKINMDPITRPYVLKSTPKKPKYLSAIIIIAQSHIALHYNYKKKCIMADIFSCAPFDYSKIKEIYAPLGEVVSNTLIARGTKHIYKVKSNTNATELKASMKWQRIVKK